MLQIWPTDSDVCLQDSVLHVLRETLRALKRPFLQKVIGCALTLSALLGLARAAFERSQRALSVPQLHAELGRSYEMQLLSAYADNSKPTDATQNVYCIFLSVPVSDTEKLIRQLREGGESTASLPTHAEAQLQKASTTEGAASVPLFAHIDSGVAGQPLQPSPLQRVHDAAAIAGVDLVVEITVLWSGDAVGAMDQHIGETLAGLLQATVKSYLDGGLGMHHLLDARRGKKARHEAK